MVAPPSAPNEYCGAGVQPPGVALHTTPPPAAAMVAGARSLSSSHTVTDRRVPRAGALTVYVVYVSPSQSVPADSGVR